MNYNLLYLNDFARTYILNECTLTKEIDDKGSIVYNPRRQKIIIPKCTLKEYYDKSLVKDSTEYYAKIVIEELLIKDNIIQKDSKMNTVQYTVFYLLHEEGHFVYQKKLGFTDIDIRKYIDKYKCQKKDWELRYSDDKSIEAQKAYRSLELEACADEYATRNLIKNENIRNLFYNV